MYYSVNFRAKGVRNNPTLIKIEMIIYKTGFPRVQKEIPVTGKKSDWNPKTQKFEGSSTENSELNLKLAEIHKKYIQLADEWENAKLEWDPIHLSHYYDNPVNQTGNERRILTVYQVYDNLITRYRNQKRIRNGHEQTGEGYAVELERHRKQVQKFVKLTYSRDLKSYYFPEINEEFIQAFAYHVESEGIKNGNRGNLRTKLFYLHRVVLEAQGQQIPGANIQNFRCVDDKFKEKEFDPKTIPYPVLLQIEHIDRSLLSKKERYHLDVYLFCFYCGGMAPTDAAHLRGSAINLKDNRMEFQRMKTGRLAKPIFIPKAREITEKYRSQCFGEYVLPILKEKRMDEKQRKRRITYFESEVNRTLERVATLIGYDDEIKFYSCRGTYITRMIDLGVHPIVVAEQSGNSPEAIYKHYYKTTNYDELNRIVLGGL